MPRPHARSLSALAALVLAATLLAAVPPTPTATAQAVAPVEVVAIQVLGSRADLVSGGDALVRVEVPADADPADVRLALDGAPVEAPGAVTGEGTWLGRVEGMAVGAHVLTATLPDGRGASLALENHPRGGPVFSGPQIQPWTCTNGSADPQCDAPTTFTFLYRSTNPLRVGFQPYDPASPPTDVATTTTDEGMEVPFVIRLEQGVIDRDNYSIAVLYDPDQPWEPWAPQPQFNDKLVITHGASCDTHYEMAAAPDVTAGMLAVPGTDVLVPDVAVDALGAGFAVMSHALNNSGHNCNVVVQAEAMLMTKEHLVDTYGPLRYTIGSGCSGGALAQYWTANAYPGLYDGITVACSFPDAGSSAMQYIDYALLREYFEDPTRWGVPWEAATIGAVYGHPNPANAATFTEVIPNSGEPTRACTGVPEAEVYDEATNPDGVRCTLQDYNANALGRRPDGFANRPYDNTGVQYGLQALRDGLILPQQFVDLNLKAGGYDIDLTRTDARYEADAPGLERIYRTGLNNTASNLDEVAIIDYRGPDPGAFHDTYRTYALRDRLVREHGHADNMVLWRGSVPLFGDVTYARDAVFAMDRWLAAVEADPSDRPLAERIVANRPADVTERCASGAGQDVPAAYCDAIVDVYQTPRIVAGMPETDDVMKCQLVPLASFDYEGLLTDAQIAQLAEAFPTGVCDYGRPGVGEVDTVPWLDYTDVVGGRPLWAAPVSQPLQPLEVSRLAGADRIATAIEVSRATREAAETVLVATADGFADALAGAPLAAASDAPLLLSGRDALPAATAAELTRLGAREAVLLGGTAALGEGVEQALIDLGLAVTRLSGPDRYATSAAIAEALATATGHAAVEVVVAAGESFADALGASALAAAERIPILLTPAGGLPADVTALLGPGTEVTLVGGTAAAPSAVETELRALTGSVRRLSGGDRYATAAAVVEEVLDARGGTASTLWVATGAAFPDGLVAGAAAGSTGAALLLVDGADPLGNPATADLLARLAGRTAAVRVVGGPGAVSPDGARAIGAALGG